MALYYKVCANFIIGYIFKYIDRGKKWLSYHNSINLHVLTEGLLLALYIKHAQVSNNAKNFVVTGVEEAILHWSGKHTNRNVSLGGLGACLPGKFMP